MLLHVRKEGYATSAMSTNVQGIELSYGYMNLHNHHHLLHLGIYLVQGSLSSIRSLVKQLSYSHQVLDFISDALHGCLNHPICRREPSVLPTRVIDVAEDFSVETFPYLTKKEEGASATLSYCWGGKVNMLATEQSLSSFQAGMALADVPATIRHAVLLCCWLRIRYLRIDAVCIMYDDEADFAREAACMGQYYQQALFVISAYQGEHTDACFHIQRSARVLSMPGADIYVQHRGNAEEQVVMNLETSAVRQRA